MNQTFSLDNKTALVTGGASGIGKAIATELAELGAYVLIHDINEMGQEVAKNLGGIFLKADFSDMNQTRELAQNLLKRRGSVDILTNNAGFQHMSTVEDFPEDTWAKLIQVLLVAPFQLTKYLVPGMKEKGWGRIINMSSIHGLVASPYKSAYVAAKHGLIGFTKTVAIEVGSDNITVNAICPTFTRTPLVERQIGEQAEILGISKESVVQDVMLGAAAIKRLVEPEEVAKLACYLVSEDAKSITGAAFPIDAGWTAR